MYGLPLIKYTIIHYGIDTSYNFTGDSPVVRDDIVTFQLSLGGGIVEAKCAVLQGTDVLEEVTCEF